MKEAVQINNILSAQDRKINEYLLSREKTHFFYAYYTSAAPWEDELTNAHRQGFDNYPLWTPRKENMIFFWERAMGCDLDYVDGKKDYFHTFCVPCVKNTADVSKLKISWDINGVWRSYLDKVQEYAKQEDCLKLPLMAPGLNLLDCACGICGTERLFTLMYDNENAAEQLFDYLTEVYLECIRQLKSTGIKIKNPYGFPGVYCNDLQMPYLSPFMIKRFVLPCYRKIARESGGLILAINCADLQIAEEILNMDGIIGASFHKGIPLHDIKRVLGGKLFVINHYTYMDELDKPTLVDGIYCNPIVHTYSRELEAVWQELSAGYSMLVSIERNSFCQVIDVKNKLLQL